MSARRNIVQGVKLHGTTHPGLWLDRYLSNQPPASGNGSDKRGVVIKELIEEVASLSDPAKEPLAAYKSFYSRWEKRLNSVPGCQTGKATCTGRLAIGMGNESVLETNISLHHTYGVPYIPGSALKGLTAFYARREGGKAWEIGSESYSTLFGKLEQAGYITFFDALPDPSINHRMLEPDVITVHHPKYYQGNKDVPPADWDSPNPVPFLTATGQFLIAIAGPASWVKVTFQILGDALREYGVGAKTSSGYGRMILLPNS